MQVKKNKNIRRKKKGKCTLRDNNLYHFQIENARYKKLDWDKM